MAASDGQVLCSAARWAPGGRPLGEVVKGGLALPAVLRIVRGSCGGLGVPSLPHPTLQPTVMLVSAGRRRQIIAQAVKLRPGRGPVAVGPRLSIPETYAGWFELLSEEGRAGRCVESVAELSRRPCPCLVREPLRAILAKDQHGPAAPTADPPEAPTGVVEAAETSRTLAVGETISPGEEVSLPGGANHPRGRYLTCATSRGDTVLLSLEQRGRFSPLAKEHNISGAHSARTLLAKRLPLTVRLGHGPPPRPARPLTRPRKAASLGHFTPDMPLRLLAAYEEEQVFAFPLQKDNASLVAVPLTAPLKVLRTRNEDVLCALPEFARVAEKCTRLLAEVRDRIHVLDAKASPAALSGSPAAAAAESGRTWRGVPFLRRSASSDAANLLSSPRHHQDENRAPGVLGAASSSPRLSSPAVTPDEYDEIDQIYDYVRGFAPLPKSVAAPARSSAPPSPGSPPPSSARASPSGGTPSGGTPGGASSGAPTPTKPEPPPIETIPGKKVGGSKVHGHALNGGLVNGHLLLRDHPHHHHHHNHHPHHQQPPPLQKAEKRSRHKESKGTRLYLKHLPANGLANGNGVVASSPLGLAHSARYKSMTNIHGAMELDGNLAGAPTTPTTPTPPPVASSGAAVASGASGGVGTLDSSHSGGRTSGDSGPGNKLPEKRSRKLSRPRSLTNLVWEIRGVSPATALDPHRSKLSLTGHKRLGTLYL